MTNQNEPPADCPKCGEARIAVIGTGPDAEDIRFDCGCPVPVEVMRELMSGAPFDDASGGDDS